MLSSMRSCNPAVAKTALSVAMGLIQSQSPMAQKGIRKATHFRLPPLERPGGGLLK